MGPSATAPRPHRRQDRQSSQPTPGAAATIVPYDVESQISRALPNKMEQRIARGFADVEARIWQRETRMTASYEHPERSPTVVPMSKLIPGRSATIEGRITEVEDVTNGAEPFTRWSSATTVGRSALPFNRGMAERTSFQAILRSPGRRAETRTRRHPMTDPSYQVVE